MAFWILLAESATPKGLARLFEKFHVVDVRERRLQSDALLEGGEVTTEHQPSEGVLYGAKLWLLALYPEERDDDASASFCASRRRLRRRQCDQLIHGVPISHRGRNLELTI